MPDLSAAARNDTQLPDGRWVPSIPLPEPRLWRLWRLLRLMPRKSAEET